MKTESTLKDKLTLLYHAARQAWEFGELWPLQTAWSHMETAYMIRRAGR